MINTILIPFDFSSTAYECVKAGCILANVFNAHVSILHVFPLKVKSHYLSENQLDQLESQQTVKELEKMNSALQPLLSEFQNLEITLLAEVGIPSEEILRIGLNYDLIVMGTKGLSEDENPVLKRVLGSTIEAVVYNHFGPILLIPPKYQFKVPQNLLYLSALREWSPDIKNYLSYLHEKIKFNLIIAHFLTGKGITEDMVKELLEKRLQEIKQIPTKYYSQHASHEEIPQLITQLVLNEKIDLIMTVSKKRSLLDRFLKPSLSLRLYEIEPVPIWIYRHD